MAFAILYDTFFKRILASETRANCLIRAWMPAELRGLVGDAKFQAVRASFIAQGAVRGSRQRHPDYVFVARLCSADGRERHVIVIFEHKSTVKRGAQAQLREYAHLAAEHYAREHPDMLPPAVVLLVPYHGARAWPLPEVTVGAEREAAPWDAYVLQLPYRLFDLSRMAAAELPAEDPVLRAMLRALGLKARKPEELLRSEPELLEIFQALPEDSREEEDTLELLASARDHARDPQRAETFQREMRELLMRVLRKTGRHNVEDKMGSLLETWFGEGKAEGLTEGLTQGRAEGKAEGKAELLERQLARRFGPLSKANRARVAQATAEELDGFAESVLDAESINDVLLNGSGKRRLGR